MKQLFICESHNHVLLPWAMVRKKRDNLLLLTFDHHTDTHDAFSNYLYYHDDKEKLDYLISKINYKDPNSLVSAIKLLKNDEHIDTALKCKIINKAFVISFDGSFDRPTSNEFESMHKDLETKVKFMLESISLPKSQTYPESDLYVVGTYEYIDDDNCISDMFLSEMLKKIKEMSHIDIAHTDFILDIDLDYFHTYDALNRNDLNEFRDLLARAYSITIATEPEFIKEGVNSELLLNKLITFAKQENNDNLEIIDLRQNSD